MNLYALLLAGIFAASASANDLGTMDTKHYEISSVEISEVQDDPLLLNMTAPTRMDCQPTSPAVLNDAINWSEVVKLGEQLWQLVAKNRPVVNIQTPMVHVLPAGSECWLDLQGWQGPYGTTYRVEYKNGYGIKVISTEFRVSYFARGSVDGRGSFVSNATIQTGKVDVLWGFNFTAAAETGAVMNVGSTEKPVAGLPITLKWQTKNVLKESQGSVLFFLNGEGKLKLMN